MRKLVESTYVTLDGVIENPQNWSLQYFDEEYLGHATDLLFDADALLAGRVTFEGFAEVWPTRDRNDFVDRINGLPKYVASRTLDTVDGKWNGTVIKGDLVEEVTRLKEQPGGTILKYGTGEVDKTLIPNRLVDELHLWMIPVIAGSGARLLDGMVELTHLTLLDQRRFASGVVVLIYGPR